MEKYGNWLKISPAGLYECSICKQIVMTSDIDEYKFCHGCGAAMNKEEQKEEQTEDYLKKDEILKKIRNDYDDYNLSKDWEKGVNFAINRILSVPAAKVKELVNGEWISDEDGNIHCSICGIPGNGESFCEHCGADMRDELIEAGKNNMDTDVHIRWIPCSERLPKEDGRYLCTYQDIFYGGENFVDFGWFDDGQWIVEPLAWMPCKF